MHDQVIVLFVHEVGEKERLLHHWKHIGAVDAELQVEGTFWCRRKALYRQRKCSDQILPSLTALRLHPLNDMAHILHPSRRSRLSMILLMC